LFIQNLYDEVLLNPRKNGASELYIVSGYASASFANRHIENILEEYNHHGTQLSSINLIIGMKSARNDDLGFKRLIANRDIFNAYYYEGLGDVHCKMYAWFSGNEPFCGFSGSANYSTEAFINNKQKNQMNSDSAVQIKKYFRSLLPDCKAIQDTQTVFASTKSSYQENIDGDFPFGEAIWEIPDKNVSISLISSRLNEVPQKHGLNWGQNRGRLRRDEAVLQLYGSAKKLGFLPETKETFTLITDDGQAFDVTLGQKETGRHVIQTTNDNTEFGVYFRNRLGLELGTLVTLNHLKNYGRTFFTLEKKDEETFFLDFSI